LHDCWRNRQDGDHQAERAIFLDESRFLNTDSFADVRAKGAQLLERFVTVVEMGTQEGVFRSLPAPRPSAAGLVWLCSFPLR
jgi:hypothetical protein